MSATRPRETWRGHLNKLPLMVPTPMTARFGLTRHGKETERSLTNTDPNRRFLVIEFDSGDVDMQAAVLLYLAEEVAPLTLVVHSGGKSLHGWFYCLGVPELKLEGFMRRACALGADPATWCRCQLVRIPGGTRETGEPQKVHFYAPKTINEG